MKKMPEDQLKDKINSEKSSILLERAAHLAKPLLIETNRGNITDGLGFLLSDEHYIIDAGFVVEVIRLHELTPLPCSPPFILGLFNIGGRILSVINLKNFLNLPEKGITNLNRVIVVKHKDIEVGLLVDEVIGKLSVYKEELSTNLQTLSTLQKEYFVGITKDRSVVLNIEKFLSDEKIVVNEEVR